MAMIAEKRQFFLIMRSVIFFGPAQIMTQIVFFQSLKPLIEKVNRPIIIRGCGHGNLLRRGLLVRRRGKLPGCVALARPGQTLLDVKRVWTCRLKPEGLRRGKSGVRLGSIRKKRQIVQMVWFCLGVKFEGPVQFFYNEKQYGDVSCKTCKLIRFFTNKSQDSAKNPLAFKFEEL